MPIDLGWLHQSVPLWAYLATAFLFGFTNPYSWSDRLAARIGPLIDHYLPLPQGNE
jgi:hypothetical protein